MRLIIIIFTLFSLSLAYADKQVIAHYLSWFQTTPWGKHWEGDVNQANPNSIDPVTGQRQIASIHYPLIGPYDSTDSKTLEYHVLLAQSCGLGGFVINYYGTNNSAIAQSKQGFDAFTNIVLYLNTLNNNTVYSDFKLSLAYDENALGYYTGNYVQHASNDIEFIKNNYAGNSYYYNNQDTDKPFLMIWPYWQKITNHNDWINLLNSFTNFFAIDMREYPGEPTLTSHFPWVQDSSWTPTSSPNPNLWGESYLDFFYTSISTNSHLAFASGGVWPGFDEEGWLGYEARKMNRQDTLVYKNTWQKVHDYTDLNPPMTLLQIITWNDWGEATDIEPSVEYGYKFIKETRDQVNIYRSFNLNDDLALLVPQYIYNTRLSNTNTSLITNAIQKFYAGSNIEALQTATTAMGTEIPEIIEIQRGDQKILVKWKKVSSSAGYKVYSGLNNDYLSLHHEFNVSTVSDPNTTNIIIQGTDNSKDYYYAVSSYVGENPDEKRYKIEGWVSPLTKAESEAKGPFPVTRFQAKKTNNTIKLSWITPNDPDYFYTAISYMSSSRYPDTPHEGQLVVKITNAPNTYAEYFFNTSLGGYKYFSAFAMDQVDNHSEPAFANVFIIDKPVKLAGNLIHPADNNMQVKIYIDTYQAGQKVDIKIYNMKGKVMKSFGEKTLSPGRNQFVWPETEEQLNDIPSGIYILSVTGDIEQREKIVVVK